MIRDVYLRVRMDDETNDLLGYEFIDPPTPAPTNPPPAPVQPPPAMPAPPIATPTQGVVEFVFWLYGKIFGTAPAETQTQL